jgi:hypothetical protein
MIVITNFNSPLDKLLVRDFSISIFPSMNQREYSRYSRISINGTKTDTSDSCFGNEFLGQRHFRSDRVRSKSNGIFIMLVGNFKKESVKYG